MPSYEKLFNSCARRTVKSSGSRSNQTSFRNIKNLKGIIFSENIKRFFGKLLSLHISLVTQCTFNFIRCLYTTSLTHIDVLWHCNKVICLLHNFQEKFTMETTEAMYTLCRKDVCTTAHILGAWKVSLLQGRYIFRHDTVLRQVIEAL